MSTEYDTNDIHTGESSAHKDLSSNDNNEFSNIFENYSHLMFNFNTSDTLELPKDDQFIWILI